jgi:hypothetical protein
MGLYSTAIHSMSVPQIQLQIRVTLSGTHAVLFQIHDDACLSVVLLLPGSRFQTKR